MENVKMSFVLEGFRQKDGIRTYAFVGVTPDRVRTAFTVETNVEAARRYGILLQDLPLLCRAMLERKHEGAEGHSFCFTEADMVLQHDAHVARLAAVAARKPPRRPAPTTGVEGHAWRTPGGRPAGE